MAAGWSSFLAEPGADVTGVISGFDRLRLRASLRWLNGRLWLAHQRDGAGVGYVQLVQHGIQHCGSTEVLRFLGRVVPAHGSVHRLYKGEIETSLQHRPEGVRLKHYASGNSIKIYDKHGQVLRIETMMNHPEAQRATADGAYSTRGLMPCRQ